MPIANCFIKSELVKDVDFGKMVDEWAELIGIDKKDITLNVIMDFMQFGENFSVMVNLFLPTVWKRPEVEKIQITLFELLEKHLSVKSNEIFILTSMIESGNVCSNGSIEKWE